MCGFASRYTHRRGSRQRAPTASGDVRAQPAELCLPISPEESIGDWVHADGHLPPDQPRLRSGDMRQASRWWYNYTPPHWYVLSGPLKKSNPVNVEETSAFDTPRVQAMTNGMLLTRRMVLPLEQELQKKMRRMQCINGRLHLPRVFVITILCYRPVSVGIVIYPTVSGQAMYLGIGAIKCRRQYVNPLNRPLRC